MRPVVSHLLLFCSLASALKTLADWSTDRKCAVLLTDRGECGNYGISEEECLQRNCCWRPAPKDRGLVPWCFHPRNITPPYTVVARDEDTFKIKRTSAVPDKTAVTILSATVQYQADSVRILIKGKHPTEVPGMFYEPMAGYPMPPIESVGSAESSLKVVVKNHPFQFSVQRKDDGTTLFDTEARDESDPFDSIIFKANHVEIGTRLRKNHYIYGLGERTGTFRKKPARYALNARDMPAYEGHNTYGAHPFYLEMQSDGKANGVVRMIDETT